MRSLFHFPFPCTTTLAATVPLQPEICHRPHPAPMRRQRRSPALLSAARPLPRSRAYLDPAHGPLSPAPRAPAMPRPHPCLAPPPAPIAPHHLSTAPLPPAPIGLASSASRPPHAVARIASTPLRAAIRIPLCRHRADSALIAPHRAHRAPPPASRPPCADIRVTPPISLLALRRPQGPGWQEPRRMHPFFAECAKKAPFLAISARNACFSRSRWQHPRPMHPFPGAIRRFRIHGARILPPRALFRVEEPEITHDAKMLPAPPGLSAAAACGMAERALRPAARAWRACRMRPPCRLACARRGLRPRRPRSSPPSYTRRASLPASRPRTPPSAAPPIAVGMSCRSSSSCCPRAARTDASRYLRAAPIPPAAGTHRVQETSGTTQTTQCGHKNRIPKWGPY